MKKKYFSIVFLLILGNLLFSSPIQPAYYKLEDMQRIDSLETVNPEENTYVFVYSRYNNDGIQKINEFLKIFYYSMTDYDVELRRFDLSSNLECINEQEDKCQNLILKDDPLILNMYDNQTTIYDENDIDNFLVKYY